MKITPQEGSSSRHPYVVYGVSLVHGFVFWSNANNLKAARNRAREAAKEYRKAVIFELKVVETISEDDKKGD